MDLRGPGAVQPHQCCAVDPGRPRGHVRGVRRLRRRPADVLLRHRDDACGRHGPVGHPVLRCRPRAVAACDRSHRRRGVAARGRRRSGAGGGRPAARRTRRPSAAGARTGASGSAGAGRLAVRLLRSRAARRGHPQRPDVGGAAALGDRPPHRHRPGGRRRPHPGLGLVGGGRRRGRVLAGAGPAGPAWRCPLVPSASRPEHPAGHGLRRQHGSGEPGHVPDRGDRRSGRRGCAPGRSGPARAAPAGVRRVHRAGPAHDGVAGGQGSCSAWSRARDVGRGRGRRVAVADVAPAPA